MFSLGILCVFVAVLGYVYYFRPVFLYTTYIRWTRWRAGVVRKRRRVGSITWAYSERNQASRDKATLVLVHGFASASDCWNWMIKCLPDYLHVIAVDLPGHGETEAGLNEPLNQPVIYFAASLKALLEEIGLGSQPLHIAGHSLGGATVGVYSAEYPTNVRQVSFICPAMSAPVASKMRAEDRGSGKSNVLIPETVEAMLHLMNDYSIYTPRHPPTQFLKGMLEAREKNNAFLKLVMQNVRKPENDGRLNRVMHRISPPAHIVWGTEDKIADISCAELLRSSLPNVQQWDIFSECGHFVDIDKPELLAAKLYLFWSKYNTTTQ